MTKKIKQRQNKRQRLQRESWEVDKSHQYPFDDGIDDVVDILNHISPLVKVIDIGVNNDE